MTDQPATWWDAPSEPPAAEPAAAGPSGRRMLIGIAALPWVAVLGLVFARGDTSTSAAVSLPPDVAGVEAPVPPVAATAATAVGTPDLSAAQRTLVIAAVRNLVTSGTTDTARWPDEVEIDAVTRRPGVVVVGVRVVVLEGRDRLERAVARNATVALITADAGTTTAAWWRAGPSMALEVGAGAEALDAPDLLAAATEGVLAAGYADATVQRLLRLPGTALLLVDVRAVAPHFSEPADHRLLLDGTDFEVLDDPWGEP